MLASTSANRWEAFWPIQMQGAERLIGRDRGGCGLGRGRCRRTRWGARQVEIPLGEPTARMRRSIIFAFKRSANFIASWDVCLHALLKLNLPTYHQIFLVRITGWGYQWTIVYLSLHCTGRLKGLCCVQRRDYGLRPNHCAVSGLLPLRQSPSELYISCSYCYS